MTVESQGSRIRIERYNQLQMECYCRQTGQPYRDFQETLGDQSIFARREPEANIPISDGVDLSIEDIDLPNGFTVSYDLRWRADDDSIIPSIESRPYRFYSRNILRHEPSILAMINAGFFFLADEAEFKPKDMTYNLCIRQGEVAGLPSVDRPALLVKNGQLIGRDVNAVGKMTIGGEEVEWVGANSKQRESLPHLPVLYNSACCASEHQPDSGFASGLKRVLTVEKNFTPRDNNAYDLIITRVRGNLMVDEIVQGGGTNFFDGLFILQITGTERLQQLKSAHVIPTELDGIRLNTIDSAVTVGPNVHHFKAHDDHEINHDVSLGSLPPFGKGKKKARSVIYIKDGVVHMRVFDGAPFTSDFKGVSPEETSDIIGQEGIEWAYHCDPGHSARIVARTQDSQILIFGSKQKFRRPKNRSLPKLWNAPNGTPISSTVALRRNAS